MVTRLTPVGRKLDDGHPTKIAFALAPDVSFWEKTVTGMGIDGGDAIETTTMHNLVMRTTTSRALKTLTQIEVTVAYDPRVYDQIIALINEEGQITVHFPDQQSINFFGFLQKFEPDELVEGEQPEATVTIVATNTDPETGEETDLAPQPDFVGEPLEGDVPLSIDFTYTGT